MDISAISASDVDPFAPHFTRADVESAVKVLSTFVDMPELKNWATTHDDIKTVLDCCRMIVNITPEEAKERKKRRAKKMLEDDHKALAQTGIRELRKVKMVGQMGGSVGLQRPPKFGSIEANTEFVESDDAKQAMLIGEKSAKIDVAVNGLSEAESHGAPISRPLELLPSTVLDPPPEELPPPRKLNFERSCHICAAHFTELHAFYDQLCGKCAEFNYAKRFSKADMTGRVCIVTGARVKIGYAVALKLLRMGATVVATTRFPHNAAARYAEEPDSASFKGRLTIYGLDFRDMKMLHHFTAHMRLKFGRLDVLINNAAQTVRRPPAFFEHLMAGESNSLPQKVLDVVEVIDVFRTDHGRYLFGKPAPEGGVMGRLELVESGEDGGREGEHIVLATEGGLDSAAAAGGVTAAVGATMAPPFMGTATNASAAMSQVALIDGDKLDVARSSEAFPPGLFDRDDQQVDLRTENSWTLEMGQISTVEMVECHVINSFAPWVLISELKPLMASTRSPNGEGTPESWDKFIVNVSAMEGQFYRNKSIFHPHTNMAKASLNMMTRTAAAGFSELCIFMTAVDTGWINDEKPVDQWHKREHQPPPLDEWDAACRIIDPVLCGVRGEKKMWGTFLKNYFPTRW